MTKYIIWLLLLMTILSGCDHGDREYNVKYIGELKKIMHQNDVEAKVSLDTILNSNTYGLGAMDSLRGEIFINKGSVYISRALGDSVVNQKDSYTQAALLVYADIKEWEKRSVSDSINSLKSLEKFIESTVQNKEYGDIIPFMIVGTPKYVAYHIIRPAEDGQQVDHKEMGYKGIVKSEKARMIGFYSKKHEGIFTHHGSAVHVHILIESNMLSAHVDDLNLSEWEFKFYLPKI